MLVPKKILSGLIPDLLLSFVKLFRGTLTRLLSLKVCALLSVRSTFLFLVSLVPSILSIFLAMPLILLFLLMASLLGITMLMSALPLFLSPFLLKWVLPSVGAAIGGASLMPAILSLRKQAAQLPT